MPYPVLPITFFFFSSPPFSEAYLEFSFPLPLLLLLFSSSSLSSLFFPSPSASSSSFLFVLVGSPPRSRFAIRSERFPGVVFFVSVLISFYFSIVAGVILRVFLVSPRLTSTFASRQFHRTFLFLFFRFRIISLCLVSVF